MQGNTAVYFYILRKFGNNFSLQNLRLSKVTETKTAIEISLKHLQSYRVVLSSCEKKVGKRGLLDMQLWMRWRESCQVKGGV